MKDAYVQHAVEYAAFRMFQRWLRRRPHDRVAAPGRRLGRMAHRLLGSKRRLAQRNVAKVFPEWSEEQTADIVKRCFEHHGAYFLEVASIGRLHRDEALARFEVEGMERLEAAVAGERGCFLTTGHFGSSELAMFPLADWAARNGRTFHGVARPLDNPRIDAEVRASRQHSGIEIIDKAGATRSMLSAYRRGGLVAVIIDQHVRESAGIQVPFFGDPAWTSPILAILSLRTGAPVVPFTCVPTQPGHYRLTVHEAIEPLDVEASGLSQAEAKLEMTRRYLAAVEGDIREQPEYWLWMHRRWR